MNRLLQLFNIKEEEKNLVIKLLVFSCSIGIATSFLKTIADSSFIVEFGIKRVPEAIIMGGLIGYSVNFILSKLFKKWGFGKVTTFLSISTSVILVSFCSFLVFKEEISSPIYWLFIVSMPISIIIENVFFGTILRYLSYEQNKRIAGLLISATVFSGVVGCFLIPVLKNILPKSEYLLLFSAVGCILYLIFFLLINKNVSIKSEVQSNEEENHVSNSLPLKKKFFWLLILFILIGAGMFYVINFGFLYLLGDIKSRYNADTVLILIAVMNGTIKLSEFTLSMFSSKILSRSGVSFGLIALPISLLAFIFLAFIFTEAHQFWIFFACLFLAKFVERVIRKGLLRPSTNVLYQLFDNNKARVQQFLDGNVASLSAVIFGFSLYLLVHYNDEDLTIPYSLATTVITGIWCVITIYVIAQYRHELFDKLKSIVPNNSNRIIEVLGHYKANHISVEGVLKTRLVNPMLIIENVNVVQNNNKLDAKSKKNLKLKIDFDKLSFLLVTHYKLELNPFYHPVSDFFLMEIQDEIDKIGLDLCKKYNHQNLTETLKVIYNCKDENEKLYAFELLTSTLNKADKRKVREIYNLINPSGIELSLYHYHGVDKQGLRNLMKSIITEKRFSYSGVLRSCAIYILGQCYVVKVPTEIIVASKSKDFLVSEMAIKVIEFDQGLEVKSKDENFGTGDSWKLLNNIKKVKLLKGLGNKALYKLLLNSNEVESIDLKNSGAYLVMGGSVQIALRGAVNLSSINDDFIEYECMDSIEKNDDAIIIYWNNEVFVEALDCISK